MLAPDLSRWLWPDADLGRQPVVGTIVNPLVFPQCVRCILGGVDVFGNAKFTAPFLRTRYGLGYSNTGNGALGIQIGASKLITSNGAGTGDFAVLMVTDMAAVASTPGVVYDSDFNGTTGAWIAVNADNTGSAVSGQVAWGTWAGTHNISVASMLDGNLHAFLFNSRAGVLTMYRDGQNISSVTGIDATWASGAIEYVGGFEAGSFGMTPTQAVQLLAVSNRGMSDLQARSLTLNPWQIFSPSMAALYQKKAVVGATRVPMLTLLGVGL